MSTDRQAATAAASGRPARRTRAGRRYPYLWCHQGVVRQSSAGERVGDSQEITVVGRRRVEPSAEHRWTHKTNAFRSVKSIWNSSRSKYRILHRVNISRRREAVIPHLPTTELFRAIFSADAVDMDPACEEKCRFSTRKLGSLSFSEDRFYKYWINLMEPFPIFFQSCCLRRSRSIY